MTTGPLTADHRTTPRRGVVVLSSLGAADRPLRTVRVVVSTAVRTAGDRGLSAESGNSHAERERRANQIPNKILQDDLSLLAIGPCASDLEARYRKITDPAIIDEKPR